MREIQFAHVINYAFICVRKAVQPSLSCGICSHSCLSIHIPAYNCWDRWPYSKRLQWQRYCHAVREYVNELFLSYYLICNNIFTYRYLL